MKESIREILDSEFEEAAGIIRDSFLTVANEFNLTKENCPTNAAFITVEKLVELKNKGILLFGLFYGSRQVGFVAVEKAQSGIFYLEKLAVLPEYRHRGYGKKLTDYVFEYVRSQSGKKISIALIDEHAVLKQWYTDYGFKETAIKKYSHLPFTVCFMEMKI